MPDFDLVPVDHDPFEGDIARAMTPPLTMWQRGEPVIRQKSDEVSKILGGVVEMSPVGQLAKRMGETYEGGIDWNDPEAVKQASGGTLLDMMALAGGSAGAAERGTVGALGGKPGMMAAAQKAVPLTRTENTASGFEHPNPDARTELMNALYPGREEAKDAVARSTWARDIHQQERENGFYLVNDPEERERQGLPPIPAHARPMRPGSGVKAVPGGPWDPAPAAKEAPKAAPQGPSWLDVFREKTSR